jgi:hypothetical protein
MPLDTKHLFVTSPELGNQFILILILTGRRAAGATAAFFPVRAFQNLAAPPCPCATGGRDHYRVLTYLKAR